MLNILTIAAGCIGLALMSAGLWMIYPPMALIFAGFVLVLAAARTLTEAAKKAESK